MMKDILRWGDPMANLIKKKHDDELFLPHLRLGDDKRMKASSFIVPQEIPGSKEDYRLHQITMVSNLGDTGMVSIAVLDLTRPWWRE